jgi:hypothetical protein
LSIAVTVQLLPTGGDFFVRRRVIVPGLKRGLRGSAEIGRRCGVGFFCGASSFFLLGTLFGFGALLFLAFHFLLALLERDTHRASSQERFDWFNEQQELPAGFAWLAGGFAVIFARESAAAPSAALTTAAAVTAATTGTVGLGPGFVDLEIAAAERFAVEGGYGIGGFGIIGHFHKSETASSAGLAIGGNMNAPDLSEGLEQRRQISFSGLKTHVSDKKIFHTVSPFELF